MRGKSLIIVSWLTVLIALIVFGFAQQTFSKQSQTCTITIIQRFTARTNPGIRSPFAGSELPSGSEHQIDAFATLPSYETWYHLVGGGWVLGAVVEVGQFCLSGLVDQSPPTPIPTANPGLEPCELLDGELVLSQLEYGIEVQGEITNDDPFDLYCLRVNNAPAGIAGNVVRMDGDLQPVVEVINDRITSTIAASSSGFLAPDRVHLETTILLEGDYIIAVGRINGSSGTTEGRYTFTIHDSALVFQSQLDRTNERELTACMQGVMDGEWRPECFCDGTDEYFLSNDSDDLITQLNFSTTDLACRAETSIVGVSGLCQADDGNLTLMFDFTMVQSAAETNAYGQPIGIGEFCLLSVGVPG